MAAKGNLTAKQESFCQAIASGMTQADAYREAYPTALTWKPNSVYSKAAQMMDDVKVVQRVNELRKPLQDKFQYGREEAMIEAEEAMAICREAKQGGAMVAAVQLRAKLNGLLVERKEVRLGRLEDMPEAELDGLIRESAAEAGLSVH